MERSDVMASRASMSMTLGEILRGGAARRRRRRLAGHPAGGGVDRLGDAATVVGEQGAGGVDDFGRAAVVDLEVIRCRAGEVAAVVDQEAGVGAGVAVDHLVVVA